MNETLKLIERVIAIPSYTSNFRAVNECFEFYKGIFNNCNVNLREVDDGGYKSILFSNCITNNFDVLNICHTDVVESIEYKLSKKENVIYGRGVFDMKSFVIINLLNLRKLIENKSDVSYGVLIVADEEIYRDCCSSKLWVEKMKLKAKIVLNNDAANKSINEIVEKNLGAISIRLNGDNIFDKKRTMNNLKSKFLNLYLTDYGEINFYFDCKNIIEVLKRCMCGNTTCDILMLNDFIVNNIYDKYHILYRNICKKNEVKINYVTSKTTDDSRFFSYKNMNVINHNATGGDYHKSTEWLDFTSLVLLGNIQLEFLKNFNSI